MSSFNINTDAAVKYTAKLERMHRSNLPIAVRNTLNSAAFDVKKNTMPISAKNEFTQRSKNFFKANSTVGMASGFNIKTMRSAVGFIENKLKGDSNFAVKDLEQQERGGNISGRSFIPLDTARKGGYATPVRPANRLSKIRSKKIVDAKNFRGNKKQRFIKAVNRAKRGNYVIGSTTMGENYLFRVTKLNKKEFDVLPLYDVKKNRSVKVKSTNFMKKASLISSKKMNGFFIKEAKKRFKK